MNLGIILKTFTHELRTQAFFHTDIQQRHNDTISMELSILYCKGLPIKISIK